MARYAETLLADGERIILRARQHWLATLIDARYPWLILLASFALLLVTQGVDEPARGSIGVVALIGVIVALLWLLKVYWSWWAQDYLVTNRRVVKVEGIVNKRAADSSLEKINDAVLEQNLVARLLNYGDLDILTAADVAVDRYRMLDRAPEFKRQMLNAKHELEGEFSRPLPGPPLRAGTVLAATAGAGAGGATAALAQPGPAPAATGTSVSTETDRVTTRRAPMTPDEVTRALGALADLRDRGAVTADEFERKKAELLDRL